MSESFISLNTCPKELYINFILKFCTSYCYFSISQVLTIYLHNEFHFTDIEAGTAYGLWGASITFWGIISSWMNDTLGVRRSLMVGFIVSAIGSTMIAITTSKLVLYVALLGIFPLGNSMGIPMLSVGIRRYTNKLNRGFAFGLFYSVMNVGAFVSGPTVDIFNIAFKKRFDLFGVHWSGNRLVILTTTFISLFSFLLTYYRLREIRVDNDIDCDTASNTQKSAATMNMIIQHSNENTSNEVKTTSHLPHDDDLEDTVEIDFDTSSQHVNSNVESDKLSAKDSFCDVTWQLISSRTFQRFAVLSLLLINLNAVFRHLDATLPTYLVREFGPGVPKGMIYSINPFMIIFLTPLVAAFCTRYKNYDMIKYGGYLTACAPFFLACSTSIWAAVCMVVMLSLGEAIWSPRTYSYTMSIAPEGREASFAALASAPLFAAKIPVGLMSGYLLSTYMPENGSHAKGQMLWLIIAIMTMSSPLLITLLEPCIREPEPATATASASADGADQDQDSCEGDSSHQLVRNCDDDDNLKDIEMTTGVDHSRSHDHMQLPSQDEEAV